MKNLTLSLEEEISTLEKYSLNADELLLIRTLLILQDDGNEELFPNLMKVFKHNGMQLRDLLISLQEKEVILKSYKIPEKGMQFDPHSIPINKNFIKNLYKCSFELGKELFEVYPQFASINGNVIPLRTVAKKFDSLEQAYFKYGKSINFNPEKHETIIELVKWASENSILNCSLASFIVNEGWNDLSSLKNGDAGNINYNAIKML